MAALYPVFPYAPDWTDSVSETLAWLTGVLRSTSGAEQRTKRRLTPRRTYQWNYLLSGRNRSALDLTVRAKGVLNWTVPIWHDATRLTTVLTSGQTRVLLTTALREFVAGQPVVFWLDSENYEALVINQVQSDRITFIGTTTRAWPVGTKVMPGMYGRLASEPQGVRLSTDTVKGSVAFTGTAANPFAASVGTLPTYAGFNVVTIPPDYSQDISLDWQRQTTVLDGDTGLTQLTDTAGFGTAGRAYRWYAMGQAPAVALRKLLYALKGRLTPVWVPSFADDLTLLAPASAASAAITVRSVGYVGLDGTSLQGREYVAVRLYDGTTLYRRIVGAVAGDSADAEVLTLDAPFPGDTEIDAVQQICFMALCRQDSDQIELSHPVDAVGVTTAGTVFREAPDLRAIAWDAWDPDFTDNAVLSQFDTLATMRYDTGLPYPRPGRMLIRVRPHFAKTTGKWYFEGIYGKPAGLLFNPGFGVCQLDATWSDIADNVALKAFLGAEYGTGNEIFCNGSVIFQTTGNLYNRACYAINLDDMLGFMRPQPTVKWNNSDSANPATGAGGVDLSGLTPPLIPFGVNSLNLGDTWRINLGTGPAVGEVPAGYTFWGYPGGE